MTKSDTWPIVWKSVVIAGGLFLVGMTAMFPKLVLELILPDQTIHADGFAEERFSEVKVGMDAQAVLTILGPPLEVVVEPTDRQTYKVSWKDRPSDLTAVRRWWWDYSKPGRISDSYNVRAIEFSRAGKVTKVARHYYQD